MYQRESDRVESTPDLERSYFDVLGICCSSEIPLVENILNKLEGVKDVKVIVVTKTVIVIHESLISSTQIVDALNRARLEASIKVSGESLDHKNKWPSPYAIASGVLLLISFLKYVYHPLIWVALVAVVSGIFPVAWKGLRAVMNCRIDINILVLVAVVGTIALSDYLESAAIVFLFCIAEWLESRATHKASAAMSSLVGIAPPKAILADTGEAVDVGDVKLDTILAVKPGDVIPIDGIVVDGKSEVDEKTLTGEFFPVGKEIDSQVWAGTINLNGYLSVRTTALAADCVIAKMAKLVEEAQNKKSRTQRLVDEFTKFYTPVVLVISISVALIPVAFTVQNQDYWFHLALVVLVSACPCALILSTPVVTFCALTKAAKGGLLVKGGDYLETLGKIRTVAFDKTGTITRGEFEVADFRCIGKDQINLETLLYWVSSIESKSSHPLAAPLIQYARTSGIEPKPEDVDEFQNFPGEGIYGKIDGKDVFIGNKKIAIKAGYDSTLSLPGNGNGGETVGYVFAGSNIVGIFSLYDECRSGVTEAIEELKSLKIRTAMVTGDSQEAAMHAQDQVDHTLDLVYAELLPEDKLKIVESLRMEGPVAMVGDGVNDAPALATADIGISMGISGSALATETGHIILMSNDIGKIPKAIVLAKKSRKKVVENLILSIATKTPILALAFAGHPLIWAAVLADSGTCILVILNSMLLLREDQGQRALEEKCRRRVSNTRSYRTNSNKASAAAAAPKSKCQCCKVDPLRELLIT